MPSISSFASHSRHCSTEATNPQKSPNLARLRRLLAVFEGRGVEVLHHVKDGAKLPKHFLFHILRHGTGA